MESFSRLKAQADAMAEANFKAEAKRRGYVPARFQLINDGEEGDPRSIFPARLREARELRGMSQTDLARETSLTPDWISHFEGGRRAPSLFILWALCEALRVPADFLIGRAWGEGSAPGAGAGAERLLRAAIAQIEGAKDLAFELGADICSDHCDEDPDDPLQMAHCVWCEQATRVYQFAKAALEAVERAGEPREPAEAKAEAEQDPPGECFICAGINPQDCPAHPAPVAPQAPAPVDGEALFRAAFYAGAESQGWSDGAAAGCDPHIGRECTEAWEKARAKLAPERPIPARPDTGPCPSCLKPTAYNLNSNLGYSCRNPECDEYDGPQAPGGGG